MRAVLDPNILISALLSSQGAPAHLLTRWLAGEFELIVSDGLLGELDRALAYPKLTSRIAPADAKRFATILRKEGEVEPDIKDVEQRSIDPGDDYLLALAERSSAFLVSGDRHLLELSEQLPVLTARQFLQTLEEAAEADQAR